MLPFYLRALLVIGAVAALFVVGKQVKKQKILVEDAVFWVVVAVVFVVIAIFPDIAINLAHALGFMSASNFVYLVIISLLLWKAFTNKGQRARTGNSPFQA